MKKIRNLLLDCRTALRRADAEFARTPLSELLDDTIIELGQAGDGPIPEAPETRTAQQVAYAWQSAARDLRFTHPELHEKLSARVLQMLDVEVFHDPATEIQALQSRVQDSDAKLRDAVGELASLRQSLVDAVPNLDGNMPAAEAARVRVRMLVEAATRGGGRPQAVAPTMPSGGGPMLTRYALQDIAEGRRVLTRDEREWCMGEAMVLSGFQKSPAQLLADGEAALARMILNAQGSV